MQEKIKLNSMILLKNPKNIRGVIMQEKNPYKPLPDKALQYALCNRYTIVLLLRNAFLLIQKQDVNHTNKKPE